MRTLLYFSTGKAGAPVGPTYTLTAGTGTFSLSGQVAGFVYRKYKLTAGTGSFSLTGQAVTMVKLKAILVALTGYYALTGKAVTFKSARRLVADVGIYSFTGQTIAPRIRANRQSAYLERVPDVPERQRRFDEKVADIINSLIRQGYLYRTEDGWALRVR